MNQLTGEDHSIKTELFVERLNVLFEIDSAPVVVLKVKIEHFVGYLPVLKLSTIYYHGVSKDSGVMVLSGKNVETFGLEHLIPLVYSVVDHYLVCAFSHLSLPIEHKAPSKDIHRVIIRASRMSASSLYSLIEIVVNILPLWVEIVHFVHVGAYDFELSHLFISIIVQTTHQVGSMIDVGKRGALSGGG